MIYHTQSDMRKRKIVLHIIWYMVLSMALWSCAKNSEDENITGDIILTGVTWDLISYGYKDDTKKKIIEGTSHKLNFSNQPRSVVGHIDCNSFSSSYTASNDKLNIINVSPTEINCANSNKIEYYDQINFIMNALSSITTYSIEGFKLTLNSSDSSQLIYDMGTS